MRDRVKLAPEPVGVYAGLMVPSGLKKTTKRLGGAAVWARRETSDAPAEVRGAKRHQVLPYGGSRTRFATMERGAAVAVCAATDVGLARRQNEDTFMIADLASGELSTPCMGTDFSVSSSGVLLLVCDGMGGHAAGEIAARIAAQVIKQVLVGEGPTVTEHPIESLKHAVLGANQAVLDEAAANPAERGMGTTCTAAVVLPARLVIGQVGDSRAYLFRDGQLRALTRDQSLASQLVDAGVLDREQARRSPHRNVLLQALGGRTPLAPVISEVGLRAGDRLLLCSDGLHGPVSHERIAEIVATTRDLTAAAKALIAEALRAGGPDNVTALVADC